MINIPQELKDCAQWICYKKEKGGKGEKERKVPKNPLTGRNLTITPDKWGISFNDACTGLKKFRFDGLGFVFKKTDNFCGIDLDHCIENGQINEKAKRAIKLCNSYTELSPSRTGIHIIVKNSDDKKALTHTKDIEVYSEGRYFTVSGESVEGTPITINTINIPLMLKKYGKEEVRAETLSTAQMQEVIDRIKESNNGSRFLRLWNGDWNSDYDSHSEADMALCSYLAFWLENKGHVDQMFRVSKLFREKWDRSVGQGKTYGQMTVEKVMLHKENDKTALSLVMELDDFKKFEMPEIKTIMAPWLTFGSTHMIYATRGVGKTFFALSIGLAICHGTDFGEWTIKESSNVMYVDGEMLPQDMKERIDFLSPNLKEKMNKWYILSSGLNFQNGGSAINITQTFWQDFIYNEVITKDIKVVFLDNIAALTPGIEENDSTAWDVISSWLNKLKQTGCAIILIHHAGKGGQQRGTSAREDALDTVITLKPTSSDLTRGVDVDVVFEKSRHITGPAISSVNWKLTSEPGSSDVIWDFGFPGVSKRNAAIMMMINNKTYTEIGDTLGVGKSTITKYKKFAVDKEWVIEKDNKLMLTKLGETILNDSKNEF